MTRFISAMVLCATVTAATSATAQTPAFPTDSAIREILRDRVEAHRTTGIVVGLVDHGKHHVIAFGDHAPGHPLDANSVFEIGSITKIFTATILADMVTRGQVRLDDPVQKFLPAGVKVPERNGKQITLEDLATQSSGLPRLPSNMHPKNMANPYADYAVQDLYDFLNGYTLTRDIGALYEYSNLGVGLLGHALALRAGTSYEELVEERVLEPLHMKTTAITLSKKMQEHLAKGHGPNGSEVANWDLPTFAGAGALRSSVTDMLKFLDAALADKGTLKDAMSLAQEPRRMAGIMHIGLNWHIIGSGDKAIVWHNGGTGGYTSYLAFNRASGRGVIILTNSANTSDDIGMHLMNPAVPLKTH